MASSPDRRERRVVIAASMGVFAIQLDFLAMQAALPQMASDLGTTINSLQWVISGYMLSLASCFIAGGRLADIYGRRTWLVLGAAVFGAASLAAGAAPNATFIIVMRIVQGVGAAILFTVSISVVTNTVAPARVQRAIGSVFAIGGLAIALGPVIGGTFTELISWRWVLWLNVPISAGVIVLVLRSVENTRDETVGRLDRAGLALIIASVAVFTYGIDRAPDWGWLSAPTLGLVAAGLLLLGLFIWVESRVTDPLVDLGLFRSREFDVMLVAGTAGNIAIVVVMFIAMIYLQTEEGFSAIEAGLAFLPFSAGCGAAGQISGRLEKYPSHVVMAITLAVGGSGTLAMGASVGVPWLFLAFSVLSGFGLGLSFSFASVVTQSIVDPDKAGAASGVVMTVLVGMGGVAIAAASAGVNTAVQGGAGTTLEDAIRLVMLVVGSVPLLCAGLVWMRGRPPVDRAQAPTSTSGHVALRHAAPVD